MKKGVWGLMNNKTDRHIFSELRTIFVEELRKDLIGPYEEKEVLEIDSPLSSYIAGILAPPKNNSNIELLSNDFEINDDLDQDDDKEIILSKHRQTSLGLKFYLKENTLNVKVNVTWGDYRHIESITNDKVRHKFERIPKKSTEIIDVSKSNLEGVQVEPGVFLSWIVHKLDKTNNRMISLYIENRRLQSNDNVDLHMFQVNLTIEGVEDKYIFISENEAYGKFDEDDYYYRMKPVFSRGYGCATDWQNTFGMTTDQITTTFLPLNEINGISSEMISFKNAFSMLNFMKISERNNTLQILSQLLNEYKSWIERLKTHRFMSEEVYEDAGNKKIVKCYDNLERMQEGLSLIQSNESVYEAFRFMNEAMHLSRTMKLYSDSNSNKSLSLEDFKGDHSHWRPFQIAYILLNLKGIVEPESKDRDIVDLLYFPTGGGKTEAYLGVIVFLLAWRRLTSKSSLKFEKDGGVTVILRYTLRLLTTQQRDRLLRVICACEILRNNYSGKFGEREFSIGFWVGGTVTSNKFKEFEVSKFNSQYKVNNNKKALFSQILKCPCCGTKLDKSCYELDPYKKYLKIYCPQKECYYSKHKIPVYLIDEEIYRELPTVLIGTVDKFAAITFEEKVHLIFGKRQEFCTECGNFTYGEAALEACKKMGHEDDAKVHPVKPYYPPELIIQDELHLITGPLGTIYGSYETVVEELCSIYNQNSIIRPKYIASTATIQNAMAQVRSLYGKLVHNQFPPAGHDSEDSFFAREISLEDFPFRLYAGVCSPYTSMKTTILRTYAVLLQTAWRYKDDPKYKEYLDPYWTLIGYFNSKRELGGTVRLLQDDIPARVKVLKGKNKDKQYRAYINYEEITSRIDSWKIPKILEALENSIDEDNYPLDVALATNMISVGMDIERLGLMVVTGQPKTTAEYIQATSRVGRNSPGLVVTIYNPYRTRDLSHYENFKPYHLQLYRYVEGTTATPFSARARDRALHAIFVSLLRGLIPELRNDEAAKIVEDIPKEEINTVIERIKERIIVVDPKNKDDALSEIEYFLDEWIKLSRKSKKLRYWIYYLNSLYKFGDTSRLLKMYSERGKDYEKATLNSMRNVQQQSELYVWGDM